MRLLVFTVILCWAIGMRAQNTLLIPMDDINQLIRSGTCTVSHSALDIGSIHDVFDDNRTTLARSASINPLVITLSFPFAVSFSTASVIQTYGDGWWSLDAADTMDDLYTESGSYVSLVAMSPTLNDVQSAASFSPVSKRIIRLTVRRTTGDDYVHLNEWELGDGIGVAWITEICARPSQIWMLPNSSTDLRIIGIDSNGFEFPISEDVSMQYETPGVVLIESSDNVTTLSVADTTHTGELIILWKGLSQHTPLRIVDDFKPNIAPKQIVDIVLVVIDPPIAAEGGLRFHERFGWDDPQHLTDALIDSLNAASEGAVEYVIRDTYDESELYADFQGTLISVDSIYRLFLEPGWTTFHQLEQLGGAIQFDYNALLDAHDFCNKSNAGEIDEIWVYSMPFTGMYESRLTGDGAFWYNSPPLDGNNCTDQLPIMGFNYERGVAEAMHSFGHRVESAMAHTYGRWQHDVPDKNDWEKFTSYDEVTPFAAHCGNIHYPPNGVSDYDYGNSATIISQAPAWQYYPFLPERYEEINCSAWSCEHLGFMSWWFRHLPHFACTNKDGILNNWWAYIVDYNEGKAMEAAQDDCACEYAELVTSIAPPDPVWRTRVYPNPTHGNVSLDLTSFKGIVGEIQIIDSTGRLVRTFAPSVQSLQMDFDINGLGGGLYFIKVIEKNKAMWEIYPVVLVGT